MTTTSARASDYAGIKAALDDYFDGLRLADPRRLEHAHMKTYIKDSQGRRAAASRPMGEWVAREPNPALIGAITSINIHSEVGAQATFDFGGRHSDAFQFAKIDDQWRIMAKLYVVQSRLPGGSKARNDASGAGSENTQP